MLTAHPVPRTLLACAALFAVLIFAISGWHWWSFQYATFDLAFYVQALWLALRGEWHVSLLNVPLLGNHAEPIVFLAIPFFAVWPHPMLLVAGQTLALATMPITAWRISRVLGVEARASIFLALAIVITPATAFVGLHEFHPEALAAPFLLFLVHARLTASLGQFWVWFVAVLACKENLALLLVAWCLLHALLDWRRGAKWQLHWNILPLALALGWLGFYAAVLSPRLNAGNVDYLELYSHLGNSTPEIVRNFFVEPHRFTEALRKALTNGNLFWALLLPFFALPLLRPQWLLICLPLLMQHLLSWRPSEWSIQAHYAAPFIPLFWVAAVQSISSARLQSVAAVLVLLGSVAAQLWIGPVRGLIKETAQLREQLRERKWKAELLQSIPADASVTAGLPFLSHLAKRRELHSLHHILKGLKTLSRRTYVPPDPTDVAVVDYFDAATFSVVSGYYHPQMRTADLRIIPSSDRLLNEFLRARPWRQRAVNTLHLFEGGDSEVPFDLAPTPLPICEGTALVGLQALPPQSGGSFDLHFAWECAADRQTFPWLFIVLSKEHTNRIVSKGACAIHAPQGAAFERWTVQLPDDFESGSYEMHLIFYDGNLAAWHGTFPARDGRFVFRKVNLGTRDFRHGKLVK